MGKMHGGYVGIGHCLLIAFILFLLQLNFVMFRVCCLVSV